MTDTSLVRKVTARPLIEVLKKLINQHLINEATPDAVILMMAYYLRLAVGYSEH